MILFQHQKKRAFYSPKWYFFLLCYYCLVAKSCPTLCSLSGSSVPGIFQARILEWVVIFFSRESSRLRDWTCASWFSCTAGRSLPLSHRRSPQDVSVQSLSCVRLFATPRITARQASLSITNSRSSLRLTSIESVMPSSHLILCRPHLLLPPIPPSIRVFSNESTLRMRWSKYWSFSFSIIPSKEIPGQISFRMDWLDLLAVQGTLKSLLQHHSSKASILWRSAFFTVQLSHPYVTTWKTIALTRRTLLPK